MIDGKRRSLDERNENISSANSDFDERGNRRDNVGNLLFKISVHKTVNFQKPGYLPQCRVARDPGALQTANTKSSPTVTKGSINHAFTKKISQIP
jgi:hypothetical protein